MPDATVITVSCPHCRSDLAKVSVSSRTVITVTCVLCNYVWCADMDAMTDADRTEAQIAILTREREEFSSNSSN